MGKSRGLIPFPPLNSLFGGAKADINQLWRRTEAHRWPPCPDAAADIEVAIFNVVKTPETRIEKPNEGNHGQELRSMDVAAQL